MRSAMATYRFRGGAMAQLWMSYDIPAPGLGSGLQFQLVGIKGIIDCDAYGAVRLSKDDSSSVVFEQERFDPLDPVSAPRLAAYALELTDLLQAAGEGRPPLVSGAEGLATTAMLEAAELSARIGQAIRL